MEQARASLRGKWGKAVPAALIYLLVASLPSLTGLPLYASPGSSLSSLVTLLLAGPMALGFYSFILALSREQPVIIDLVFSGFKRFGTALAAYLLMFIFVLLWTLLLIVPGIIAAIAYSQTYYLLIDEPELDAYDALCKSKKMMRGYKWKYCCLQLRFLGWVLLCVLTLGIGLLWVVPYVQTATAKFYEELRASYSEV
jgi:uncharacterized membrane protein